MLQNTYLFAKTGAGKAENERRFAENLPEKIVNYPYGSRGLDHLRLGRISFPQALDLPPAVPPVQPVEAHPVVLIIQVGERA